MPIFIKLMYNNPYRNIGGEMDWLGEGERQVRLGQDRLAIKKTSGKKWKRAETMYVVLPTPGVSGIEFLTNTVPFK
jgi:hypothetical protein